MEITIGMKFVFLILNYITYWETEKCVESIFETIGKEHISEKEHEIVIVDNGSTNESTYQLLNKYSLNSGVHVVCSKTNLGFAKGNNLGFKYAKEKLRPNFIVMINSDIVFTDNCFIKKVVAEYKSYNFAVAGPNVKLYDGSAINPVRSNIISYKDAEKRIQELNKKILLCKLKIESFNSAWDKIANRIKRRNSSTASTKDLDPFLKIENGEQLHGCFLIFSPNYIQLFDGLYPKTFLYGEEVLLRLRCLRTQLKMCYLSDIFAIHNESKTDKFINKGINKRHLTRYQHSLESTKLILNYLLSDDEL